jgi:superfamily II RNA helicase
MVVEKKYKFSFTAASLRTKDLVAAAKWVDSTNTKELELQIGNGKSTTGKRILLELNNWLTTLTKQQLDLLKNGSFKAQNEIAFLAVCKYFDFIRDFVVEVVREKYLVYDYELTDGDYLSFFRRKAEMHLEMETLTELTQSKIKQVTFKMLEQAGIIDSVKSRHIQPQLLELETQKAIIEDNSELFKVFLFADIDINRLKVAYA